MQDTTIQSPGDNLPRKEPRTQRECDEPAVHARRPRVVSRKLTIAAAIATSIVTPLCEQREDPRLHVCDEHAASAGVHGNCVIESDEAEEPREDGRNVPIGSCWSTAMTISGGRLKAVKNAAIGNPKSKAALAQDPVLLAALINALHDPALAAEAVHVDASIALGADTALHALLPHTRAALARALRVVAASTADADGPALWGLTWTPSCKLHAAAAACHGLSPWDATADPCSARYHYELDADPREPGADHTQHPPIEHNHHFRKKPSADVQVAACLCITHTLRSLPPRPPLLSHPHPGHSHSHSASMSYPLAHMPTIHSLVHAHETGVRTVLNVVNRMLSVAPAESPFIMI
ncbi:hypothetical protein HYPSUDRAFT_210159 [Hypholoma sublateritium FD-334 SS-4]|uniref:Uncharacterized protein n=1 Tax=Hypholoma sublateritium (strain FD-334 SS-4) TaxID=945553 RepID=A0A0D2KE03_HYPSF|nr:hypothetical protein HYPSUDRAFT_210159 [Hypholoma sublateritium FD-334 SS-4]